MRNDLNSIAYVFDKHNFLKNIKEVRSRMLLLSPIFRTGVPFDSFSLKVNKNRISLKSFFSVYLKVFFFNNKLIVSNRENFFFTNILTRVSRTLSLSANRFKNRQVNFVG